MKIHKILALMIFSMPALAMGKETFDVNYSGTLQEFMPKLHQIDPSMRIVSNGINNGIPVSVFMSNVSKIDILREIGRQAGEKASLAFTPGLNQLKVSYKDEAKPLPPVPIQAVVHNPDGSVEVVYGMANYTLKCDELCSIKLEPGEKINRLDVGDKKNWEVSPSMMGQDDNRSIVLVVRPSSMRLKTKLVVATNRRIYSVRVASISNQNEDADMSLSFKYLAKN